MSNLFPQLAAATALLAASPALAVDVHVASADGHVVTTRSGDGDAHVVRVEAGEHRVVIQSEPRPDEPWLGVLLSGGPGGARVTSVADGSPAARAGLQAGDVITAIDGRPRAPGADLGDLLDGLSPGDEPRLTVLREGEERELRVRLEGHPGRMEFDVPGASNSFTFGGDLFGGLGWSGDVSGLPRLPSVPCLERRGDECILYGFFGSAGARPRLGVVVESLSDQLARYFDVEPGSGLLVTDVVADSAAARAGIEAGDVLLRVGDREIREVGDIRSALSRAEPESRLPVRVRRRGEDLTFDVTVEAPEDGHQPWAGQWHELGELGRRLRIELGEGGHGLEWLEELASRADGEEARRALEAAAERLREVQERDAGVRERAEQLAREAQRLSEERMRQAERAYEDAQRAREAAESRSGPGQPL